MNNEEKIEMLKNNQLTENDTFKFCCNQCGECCRHRYDIILSPYDLYRIARYLKMTIPELISKYCETYIGKDSRMPIVRAKPKIHNDVCPFLKKGKCRIQEVKPIICALFPLGRASDSKGEMVYFYSGACDNANKTEISLKDWLDKFNLRESEEAAKLRGQLISRICMAKRRLKNTPEREQKLNFVIFESFYLNYNLDEEFMPQFIENIDVICGAFEKIYGKSVERALKGVKLNAFCDIS